MALPADSSHRGSLLLQDQQESRSLALFMVEEESIITQPTQGSDILSPSSRSGCYKQVSKVQPILKGRGLYKEMAH